MTQISDIANQAEVHQTIADRRLCISDAVRSVLSRRRQELGLSLQQIANRSGLTKAHVWEIEQGRSRNVCVSSVVGLAGALGVSEIELLGLAEASASALRDRVAVLESALNDLLPGKLCGESWGEADSSRVSISTSFGAIRAARAALKESTHV